MQSVWHLPGKENKVPSVTTIDSQVLTAEEQPCDTTAPLKCVNSTAPMSEEARMPIATTAADVAFITSTPCHPALPSAAGSVLVDGRNLGNQSLDCTTACLLEEDGEITLDDDWDQDVFDPWVNNKHYMQNLSPKRGCHLAHYSISVALLHSITTISFTFLNMAIPMANKFGYTTETSRVIIFHPCTHCTVRFEISREVWSSQSSVLLATTMNSVYSLWLTGRVEQGCEWRRSLERVSVLEPQTAVTVQDANHEIVVHCSLTNV